MTESVSESNHLLQQQAAEAVKEDPDLSSGEKEFAVTFVKDGDEARVFAEIGANVRRLLQHPHFQLEEIRCGDTDGRTFYVHSLEEWEADQPSITGVRGTIPIGCLKISANSRADNYPSGVVSRYDSERGNGSNGGPA